MSFAGMQVLSLESRRSAEIAELIRKQGGEPVLADPSVIARNYRTAVRDYLAEMDDLVRSTGIDYHRVKLHERYDDVLVRFLLGRTPKRASR